MKALNAYDAVAPQQSAREQEAAAFRIASRRLREASDRRSRNAALGINHKIWSIMFRDLNSDQNRLPPLLRQNCIALAVWSLDYSTRAVLSDLPLAPLIDVNERLAEGLSASSQPAAAAVRVFSSGRPVCVSA
jgi:flagellar biosynthesis regulator FlaF